MRRRRLRSGAVVLGGMGMLAVTLTACGSDSDPEPDRRCVDPVTYEQLPDYQCDDDDDDDDGSGVYYYGGSHSKTGKVSGGSFHKSAVERGGFGGSHSNGG